MESTDSIVRSPSSFPAPQWADVLWYHPPVPSTVLPFTILHTTASGSSSSSLSLWRAHVEAEVHHQCRDRLQWRQRKEEEEASFSFSSVPQKDPHPAAEDAIASTSSRPRLPHFTPPTTEATWYVLPWMAFPTLSSPHPHHSHRVLQELLDATVEASSSSSATVTGGNRGATPGVMLKSGGFLIFLLPRSYQPLEDMLTALEREEKRGKNDMYAMGRQASPLVFTSAPTWRSSPASASTRSTWEGNASLWAAMGCVSDTLCAACTVPSSSSSSCLPSREVFLAMSSHRSSPGWHLRTMKKEWTCVAFQRYASPLEEEWNERGGPRGGGKGIGGGSWTWKCLCTGVPHSEDILSRWKASTPPQWVDLVVLQRTCPAAASSSSSILGREGQGRIHRSDAGSPPLPSGMSSKIPWEDTLEYDEYLPATLPTHYHWTDQLPTFSYLEEDFLDRFPLAHTGDASRAEVRPTRHRDEGASQALPGSGCRPDVIPVANVLAHGPMSMERLRRTQAGMPIEDGMRTRKECGIPSEEGRERDFVSAWKASADAAATPSQSIFREELKKKRRINKKFKQMALSSSRDQQEWYIDEKLLQSEAAKVEWMNQISRFNFRQSFDH